MSMGGPHVAHSHDDDYFPGCVKDGAFSKCPRGQLSAVPKADASEPLEEGRAKERRTTIDKGRVE